MQTTPACPDCDVEMELGFVPDATYGAFLQTHWHRGEPEKASFFGLPSGTKVHKSQMMPVRMYCCFQCGLLRSYVDLETPRPA